MVEGLLREIKILRLAKPMSSIMFEDARATPLFSRTSKAQAAGGSFASFTGRVYGPEKLREIKERVKETASRFNDLGFELKAVKENSVDKRKFAVKLVVLGLPLEEQVRLKKIWLKETGEKNRE
jgi:hypothetical protein